MAKPGRPPKPSGEGLKTEIKIRVKEDEKEAMTGAAEKARTTLSNWARVTLMKEAEKKGAK